MLLGTLALTGFPFLSGFYSKDAIIEFAYLNNSSLGNYAATIGIFTAFLTSIYSWRLFFKVFHGTYNNKNFYERNSRLSIYYVDPSFIFKHWGNFSGYIFKGIFIGHDSHEFWQGSIFFLNEIEHKSIPLWFLLITPTLVVISIPILFYIYILNPKILEDFKHTNMPLYNFLLNKWYIDELYEKIFVNPAKK